MNYIICLTFLHLFLFLSYRGASWKTTSRTIRVLWSRDAIFSIIGEHHGTLCSEFLSRGSPSIWKASTRPRSLPQGPEHREIRIHPFLWLGHTHPIFILVSMSRRCSNCEHVHKKQIQQWWVLSNVSSSSSNETHWLSNDPIRLPPDRHPLRSPTRNDQVISRRAFELSPRRVSLRIQGSAHPIPKCSTFESKC